MKTRSKSNNFIAILIALILFATGFILLFIHQQSESTEKQKPFKTPTAAVSEATSASYLSTNTTAEVKPDHFMTFYKDA